MPNSQSLNKNTTALSKHKNISSKKTGKKKSPVKQEPKKGLHPKNPLRFKYDFNVLVKVDQD